MSPTTPRRGGEGVEAQILFLTSALDRDVTNITPRSIWPWERTSVPVNCDLLGSYAASGGNSLPTFRDTLPVPSSSVKNLEDGTDRLSRNVGKE